MKRITAPNDFIAGLFFIVMAALIQGHGIQLALQYDLT